jgi:hypothetical protein
MVGLNASDQQRENAVGRQAERLSAGAAAWVMLALLVMAAALNFIDRQILSLMVAPVKRDLGLSDVLVGVPSCLRFPDYSDCFFQNLEK